MSKLEGKVAVIVGGSTGMALATAKRFVAEGARVFITGRRQDVLDAAVEEIGGNTEGVAGDIASNDDLDRLYEVVKQKAGHVDILFVSAGAPASPTEHVTTATMNDFHTTFSINVRGVLFAVQKALPLMPDGGSIILNSSIAGQIGLVGAGLYCASKAAVRSFARTWAMELKDRAIRVNVISPGPIDTPFTKNAPQQWKDQMTAGVPLNRFGRPEEIAGAALFLASDDSSYVNALELSVDGGFTQV
ncbi:SDR family oxidoreductase [Neorhizobium sp. NCHU2750]|uniref:SDR family NAD(P)-dependent oxidoreductase n=1 Tax=Neorhizobium sp. NCHU2750 TaxID=1825976 RepID=UPI000E7220A2|nr:dehydrogenase [Neorhizobium sp. NCHU2750]